MPLVTGNTHDQKQLLHFVRNIFALAICVLVLNSCSTSPSHAETAKNHFDLAVAYMKGENFPGALKELLIAENEDPSNPFVQEALGTVYFKREKFEVSEKHYLKALSLKPDFTQARNDLAREYIETGRYTKAEELLKKSLDDLTYGNYPQTYANYGILEFKKNNFPQAIVYLKKSLEKDRENCETQVYLGRSFLESNDIESAIIQLERAVSFCTQSESDLGHYYSAIALYRGQQTDKALTRFEELTTLFPNGPNKEKAEKMIALIKKGAQ